mmetsp:Transcript_7047/g.14697  ORF Transcript_7047/g.14697 Transcript_7047/m.14697 type:complete len:97 (+) Transcript_7047:739-1029(+)
MVGSGFGESKIVNGQTCAVPMFSAKERGFYHFGVTRHRSSMMALTNRWTFKPARAPFPLELDWHTSHVGSPALLTYAVRSTERTAPLPVERKHWHC